jgi:hypothetical protein
METRDLEQGLEILAYVMIFKREIAQEETIVAFPTIAMPVVGTVVVIVMEEEMADGEEMIAVVEMIEVEEMAIVTAIENTAVTETEVTMIAMTDDTVDVMDAMIEEEMIEETIEEVDETVVIARVKEDIRYMEI